jgi:hypothetical protein
MCSWFCSSRFISSLKFQAIIRLISFLQLCDKPQSTTHQSRQDRAFDNAVLCKTKNKSYILPPSKTAPKTPELAQKSGNRKAEERKHCFSSEGRRIQPKMLEVIELICCRICSCLAAVVGLVIKSMSNEGGFPEFFFLS